MRRPVVAIFGKGKGASEKACVDAKEVGRTLAQAGAIILNGGGSGIMAASAKGTKAADPKGLAIAVLSGSSGAGSNFDLVIPTGLGDGRNVINAMACDVAIAMEGGFGTLSEIALALKTSNRQRSVIMLNAWRSLAGELATPDRCHFVTSVDDAVKKVFSALEWKGGATSFRQLADFPKWTKQAYQDAYQKFIKENPMSETRDNTNPCDNPPEWPKAPSPTKAPLANMEWATGQEKDKYGCTRDGGTKFHAGIDIKAAIGTKCYATEDAKVTSVGSGTDLGKWVAISFKKNGKTYGVAYCHLSKASVSEGSNVSAGDQLGETGITGNASPDNPHLHFEMQDQVWVAYDNAADRSKHGVNPNDYI